MHCYLREKQGKTAPDLLKVQELWHSSLRVTSARFHQRGTNRTTHTGHLAVFIGSYLVKREKEGKMHG